jgi:hypothetical protein
MHDTDSRKLATQIMLSVIESMYIVQCQVEHIQVHIHKTRNYIKLQLNKVVHVRSVAVIFMINDDQVRTKYRSFVYSWYYATTKKETAESD